MKRIFLLISIFTLLFSMSGIVHAKEERFVWLSSIPDMSASYIDTEKIESYKDNQEIIYDFWIKEVYTQKHANLLSEMYFQKEDYLKAQEFKQLAYQLIHYQISSTGQTRCMGYAYYNNREIAFISDDNQYGWVFSDPHSFNAIRNSKVREYIFIHKDKVTLK